MLAIVTGTVKPGAQMGKLVIAQEKERLEQYREALLFLIRSGAFSKIVFCENSGYDTGAFAGEAEEAKKNAVELELLFFKGNEEKAAEHGKGYGEGEIMDHVFAGSRLLQTETYFVKMTGRLKVVNIKDLVQRINEKKCYFNIPNPTIRDYYDTRLYAMPRALFEKHFRTSYGQVWDEKGIYLEKVYTDLMKKNGIKVTNFAKYPRIVGLSGTTGLTYEYTEWKCRIKDLISRTGGYKVKT